MLHGAGDRPLELVQHLRARGRRAALAHQLVEQPRVAQRSAGEHDRRDARAAERLAHLLGAAQPPGEDHRRGQRSRQLRRELVGGCALVLHVGRTRMEGDRGDARLPHETVRERQPAVIAGAQTAAQLDRHRQAARVGHRFIARAADHVADEPGEEHIEALGKHGRRIEMRQVDEVDESVGVLNHANAPLQPRTLRALARAEEADARVAQHRRRLQQDAMRLHRPKVRNHSDGEISVEYPSEA